MKTMKNLLLGIITMVAANVALASGNLQVNLMPGNLESATVEISNTNLVNYEIKITDNKGNLLYSTKTKVPQRELKKRYDLSNLEDGVYWHTVKVDKENVTKQFVINNGAVEVVNIRKSVEPYFQIKENHIDLSMLNHGNEDIKIYVYDRNNTLIDEAELGNDFVVQKRVDISELRPGNYNVVLVNNYDVYSESVKIN